MPSIFRYVLLFILTLSGAPPFPSQERDAEVRRISPQGSLYELRDKSRVWLIVRRSNILDARGSEDYVLSEVFREESLRQNYPRTYNMIARKLNKYMKDHRSLSAARNLSDSQFIIFFNVLEIRRPLGTPYAYGELFIILNQPSNPRILWRSKRNGMFVDDAVSDFLSELKAVRGEQ
jgi:hypothetical protein